MARLLVIAVLSLFALVQPAMGEELVSSTTPGPFMPPPDLHPMVEFLAGGISGEELPGEALQYRAEGEAKMAPSMLATAASPLFRSPVGLGDLDGDGVDDAVVFETGASFRLIRLVAVRSADGSAIWATEAPAEGSFALTSTQDHTGDGVRDLLLRSLAVESSADETHRRFNLTWSSAMVSGADGAIAWQQVIHGDETFSLPTLATFAFEGKNHTVTMTTTPDVDGDGASDVVANRHSGRADPSSSDSTVVAEVISGATGDVIFSRQESIPNGVAHLEPLGGSVGGTISPDLVWIRYSEAASVGGCTLVSGVIHLCYGVRLDALQATALDGETFGEIWTSDLSRGSEMSFVAVVPAVGDYDGDGANDLWLLDVGALAFVAATLVEGGTGHIAWRWEPSSDELFQGILAMGDTFGRGAYDMIAVVVSSPDPDHYQVDFVRIHGGTGTEFLRTSQEFENENDFTSVVGFLAEQGGHIHELAGLALLSDVDGDGIQDFGVSVDRLDCSPCRLIETRMTIESGRTGAEISRIARPHFFHAFPVGNLDGVGGQEFAAMEYMPDGFVTRLLAAPGEELWSLARQDAPAFFRPLGDQDGDRLDDVVGVDHYIDSGGQVKSTVSGRAGLTGQRLWDYGDTPLDQS